MRLHFFLKQKNPPLFFQREQGQNTAERGGEKEEGGMWRRFTTGGPRVFSPMRLLGGRGDKKTRGAQLP